MQAVSFFYVPMLQHMQKIYIPASMHGQMKSNSLNQLLKFISYLHTYPLYIYICICIHTLKCYIMSCNQSPVIIQNANDKHFQKKLPIDNCFISALHLFEYTINPFILVLSRYDLRIGSVQDGYLMSWLPMFAHVNMITSSAFSAL